MDFSLKLNNLPHSLSSFIGRQAALDELQSHLIPPPVSEAEIGQRLITLTGPGGVGKTRLALQLGAKVLPNFLDGVYLVELAPLADPHLITPAIASVLRVQEEAGQTLSECLTNFLSEKHLLLILDNCEHLVTDCARLAETLLQTCPGLQIIATSREKLNLSGELTWQVQPLQLPSARTQPVNPTSLTHYEAVQLFLERARTTAAFKASESGEELLQVAKLCRQLDGLPLAIELAAARLKMLSLDQLLARLQDRFRLLKGGNRTALPRQQTLQALIDWSYDLLSRPEQLLLQRLSVFAGGWELEAAETICGFGELDPLDILDLQQSLVNKSLLVSESLQQSRCRLLETIRDYASTKLVEAGAREVVYNRHLDYYLKLAEEADVQLRGPAQMKWLERLETEHPNLRIALDYSVTKASTSPGATEVALRLASSLTYFWYIRSYWEEGRRGLETVLALPCTANLNLWRARTLTRLGWLASYQQNWKVVNQAAKESLELARAAGSKYDEGWALLLSLPDSFSREDTLGVIEYIRQSLVIFEELDDKWSLAFALRYLGLVLLEINRADEARSWVERSLPLFQSLGDPLGVAETSFGLARVANWQGDYGRSVELSQQSLPVFEQLGNRHLVADVLASQGAAARFQGNFSEAVRLYTEALVIYRELQLIHSIAGLTGNLGYALIGRGKYRSAQALLLETFQTWLDWQLVGGYGWCLEGFSMIAVLVGEFERGAWLLGCAEKLREETNVPLPSNDVPDYQANLTLLQQKLARPILAQKWAEGRTGSVEEALRVVQELSPTDKADPIPAASLSTSHLGAVAQAEQPKPLEVAKSDLLVSLTSRELEVLRLVATGLSTAQIASNLVLSPLTINAYLRSIYSKLNVNSRAAATRYVFEHLLF